MLKNSPEGAAFIGALEEILVATFVVAQPDGDLLHLLVHVTEQSLVLRDPAFPLVHTADATHIASEELRRPGSTQPGRSLLILFGSLVRGSAGFRFSGHKPREDKIRSLPVGEAAGGLLMKR
jgi:hypothetical protein